jgi:hypothetical protein
MVIYLQQGKVLMEYNGANRIDGKFKNHRQISTYVTNETMTCDNWGRGQVCQNYRNNS